MAKKLIEAETIDGIKAIGGQMSNVMYNLAQRGGFQANDTDIFKRLYSEWDTIAKKLAKQSGQQAGE